MPAVPQNKHMKTFLTILGLAVVLIAAGAVGYVLTRKAILPQGSPTPTPDAMIVIDEPVVGARIQSPLEVTGRARGTWFFEASFPVVLTNVAGTVIAQTQAQAQGDWMTTEFVPFKAIVTFASQSSGTQGTLTLRKDNPSGLPANDDSRVVPIKFK
jgi:hypothetical protein